MATLTTETKPLQTAESLAGITTTTSSHRTSGGMSDGSREANNSGIDSTQSPESESISNTASTNSSQINSNNTISAAADSSDNQPATPQPHLSNANEGPQKSTTAHHPYANHHSYTNTQPSTTTTTSNTHLNQIYGQHIYSQTNMDLQQQQQQQQQLMQPLAPAQNASYPSYLNSYEQFYQQQQQQQQQNPGQTQNPQQMDFINSNSLYSAAAGVRYHPYLHAPTSGIPPVDSQSSNVNNALDANSQATTVASSTTSSLMSPRVVSSTSPSSSSNQMQVSGSASSIGSMSVGNPSSPISAGSPQCKKCGIMCTNESELQEHIRNVHGGSPYASSGYGSSPYIKEDMQQQTPPSQIQQQQQIANQQPGAQVGNPGDILDLDSQKMLYPPAPGSMVSMMHQSLGNNDPLHGLHSMQQRAGISSWDQQSQEGGRPYSQPQQQATESKNLPNHSPYYQSPKQSPYNITNSSNVIKSEYQALVKNEYAGDTQQYINEKSFEPIASNPQQQMIPPAVSSSPAEFPSTTTGGPQDNGQQNVIGNQQFRGGNFEPPSSSSAALPTGHIGGKAANWKSNEARRPKTYNCTACNKWFTSSGHLKRHYNTTLHKNAVKSSGQPDPATLPISAHHHPARDPSGKPGKRGSGAAAAAGAVNAVNSSVQQQQQPPNPVQPPEPPNSPQNYGGPQVAAGGLTPLSHYGATPSPNSMYQQQQYQQHQYMPQVQTSTSASPQHASPMANHHLQNQNQQQTTAMNGHPNALAGPSVPTTQQQTPMPSSQMRGLLNTMPSPTLATTIHLIKSERLEAAPMVPDEEAEELGYLKIAEVKEEYQEEIVVRNMYSPNADMVSAQGEEQQHPQEEGVQSVEVLRQMVHNVKQHHNTSQLPTLRQIQHFRVEQQRPEEMERLYLNTTYSNPPSNMQAQSPHIISHQQYQVQQEQAHQMVLQGTYTQIPSPPQPQHNIMEHQPCISMPLDINMQQQPNNMLQLQPPLIMEQQQLPPATTIPITNMVNMLPPSHHHTQPPQQQPTEPQPLVNTQLQLDTISTNIPSHITTSNINIPSYRQLQQPGSALPPLQATLTYPHTIIGNAEVLTLDAYGNLVSASGQHQQVLQTTDGQLVQLISTDSSAATSLCASSPGSYMIPRSPQEADIPPMIQYPQINPTTNTSLPASPYIMSYTPTQDNSNTSEINLSDPSLNNIHSTDNFNEQSEQKQRNSNTKTTKKTRDTNKKTKKSEKSEKSENSNNNDNSENGEKSEKPKTTSKKTSNKRKRNPSTSSSIETCSSNSNEASTSSSVGDKNSELPDERVKCLKCDKRFTKNCYRTQHAKSSHYGEYPFRCPTCGKRFQLENIFMTHVEKHQSTDKAHKCKICPKQFHHKTDLKRHIEAIHKGKKRYVCDICEKGFCRRDHLRKHRETHKRQRGKKKSKTSDDTVTPVSSTAVDNPDSSLENPINSSLPPAASEIHLYNSNPLTAPWKLMQQKNVVTAGSGMLQNGLEEERVFLMQYQQQIQPNGVFFKQPGCETEFYQETPMFLDEGRSDVSNESQYFPHFQEHFRFVKELV